MQPATKGLLLCNMNNLNTYTIGCQHISYNSFKCNFVCGSYIFR
jgi:hypothetical protein